MHLELLSTVAWECVHFADSLDPAQLQPTPSSFFVATVEASIDKDEFLTRIAEAFQFPDYFGTNWDALRDSLRDLVWVPASGYVLLVRGARELWRDNPQIAGTLVSVWLSVAGEWAEIQTPFHLVFAW
jgi:RNAse (barnase) inhibitor barstar